MGIKVKRMEVTNRSSSPKVITDGVDLKKGYKVVTPKGNSPQAVPLNK